MPVGNTRIVVIGIPRADKEFDTIVNTREENRKQADKMLDEIRREEYEMARLARELQAQNRSIRTMHPDARGG